MVEKDGQNPTCTADGYEAYNECKRCGYKEGFTVIPATGHSGGKATCTAKAVCDVCHEEYGEKDMDNHTGAEEWIQTADTHEKKWNCCGRVSVESEPHDWVNGICSECGYVCLHTDAGKAATCKDKAVCKVCGESFGELDANNHADLKHITEDRRRQPRMQRVILNIGIATAVINITVMPQQVKRFPRLIP